MIRVINSVLRFRSLPADPGYDESGCEWEAYRHLAERGASFIRALSVSTLATGMGENTDRD